jgi:acetoin utilization deacetylase AcuC-like enzyme
MAAHEALAAGVDSVLILDLDAHCGGGTASLIASDQRVWQTDVSVNSFDIYASPDAQNGAQRIGLRVVHRSGDYLGEIEEALKDVERQGPRFDLCIYNAGMDPFEGCSTGGLPGITAEILAERERFVFAWLREREIPTAFVLAGGYIGWGLDADGLVELHRLTLAAAAASAR